MVANQIVQVTRDAHAFGDAARLGQQRTRGTQFGIEPALRLALLGLLASYGGGYEHQRCDAQVKAGLQET